MKTLLSFIISTAIALAGGTGLHAETPVLIGATVDDPVHTPLELLESLHLAFGNNHGRAIHAKGIILEGEFTPDAHAKEISKAPHLQGPARVANGPVYFGLYAQLAEASDNLQDPSVVWPDSRKRVYLGRLAIARLTANTRKEHKALVFNPSNLPPEIEAADLMSSFYAKTFRLSASDPVPTVLVGK